MKKLVCILSVLFHILFFSMMPILAAEIHTVSRQGNLERVKEIIEKKPDQASAKDNRNCTPIHFAADSGQLEVIKYLLSKGAELSVKDVDGDTPLNWAVYSGHKNVAIFIKP